MVSAWPSRMRKQHPVSRSHSRTVSSIEPERARRGSALHATLQTQLVWPSRTRRQSPVSRSHSLTVWSPEPERAGRGSVLHAPDVIGMAFEDAQAASRLHVPHPHRVVITAGEGALSIRSERVGPDRCPVVELDSLFRSVLARSIGFHLRLRRRTTGLKQLRI